MADIFISYSKGYRGLTVDLADDLKSLGYSVWWDASLVPGDRFREVISTELAKARAAVVIWTAGSVRSDWVYSEASRARSRRILITVRHNDITLDDIPPPFDAYHTEFLSNREAIYAAIAALGVKPSGSAVSRDVVRTADRLIQRPEPLPQATPSGFDRSIAEQIRSYLLSNPEILRECMTVLEQRDSALLVKQGRAAIETHSDLIFDSPRQVVIGNPRGDISLVEFFDYNCGYCRRALADTLELLKSDQSLRIVLKEFPVLGPGSLDAARIAIAVRMQESGDKKYFEFHKRLLGLQEQVTREQAASVARELGFELGQIENDATAQEISSTLQENARLAEALGMNGTPSYVVGSEILVGALGFAALSNKIGVQRAAKSGLVRTAGGIGEEIILEPRTIACTEGKTTWVDSFDAIISALKSVYEFLELERISPASSPVVIYTTTSEEGFTFVAGVPISEAPNHRSESGTVSFSTTPGGPSLLFAHRGPYEELGPVYDEITKQLDEKRIEAKAGHFEEYISNPINTQPEELIIYVHVPIVSSRSAGS